MPYSHIGTEWGEICGLKASDLSVDLLKKIKFEKLLEFLEDDQRVQHVIANRMLDEDINVLKYFRYIPEDTILKFPNVVAMYNRFLEKRNHFVDKVYGRSQVIIWHMLNEKNKKLEVERWISGNNSIINESNVNYEWLYSVHPKTADKLVEKMWLQENTYKWRQSGIKNMIRSVPKDHVSEIMKKVFESKNKDLHLEALGNPHLSEEYTLKALKIMAKRANVPSIRASITKKIIEDLPSITRLEVIEKLITRRTKIKDIKDEDEFKMLFLGSIMRYPRRVEYVVSRYKNIRSKDE
jgi:hypothetical protein